MVSKKFKMKFVYVVQHSYELEGCDETKFIGVFSSEKKAKKAIKRLKKVKGFKKYKKNFYLDKYVVDQVNWLEGFITQKENQNIRDW